MQTVPLHKVLYFLEFCIHIKSCLVVSLLGSVEGKCLCKPNTLRDEADINTFCLVQRNVQVSVNARYIIYV